MEKEDKINEIIARLKRDGYIVGIRLYEYIEYHELYKVYETLKFMIGSEKDVLRIYRERNLDMSDVEEELDIANSMLIDYALAGDQRKNALEIVKYVVDCIFHEILFNPKVYGREPEELFDVLPNSVIDRLHPEYS